MPKQIVRRIDLIEHVPIFAINLDISRDRWASVSGRCAELGLELHRVPAVDGQTVAPENHTGFNKEKFESHCGRTVLPGEYGCYRSHLLALQAFIDHGSAHGLIIEDDVLPNAKTAERINAVIENLPKFDVVRLVSHRSNLFLNYIATSANDHVGRAVFGPQGSAAAYLVSRDGAQKLLAALQEMFLPWDVALERFWASETEIFSTRDNVLEFSSHRSESNIISSSRYADAKFALSRRISAHFFQLAEGFRRAHAVLTVPKPGLPAPAQEEQGKVFAKPGDKPIVEIAAIAGLLLFLSAVWIETDVYRFAGVAMLLAALVHYFRTDLFTYRKALIGPVGLACVAWVVYVLIRMGYSYLTRPGEGFGTAEGVYLFPLMYPTLGYAFFLFIRRPFAATVVFMGISFVMLLIGTDFQRTFTGARALAVMHNNTIHGSNASGFMLICATAFGSYVLHRHHLPKVARTALLALAVAVFAMSGLSVIGLQAKGVWVALAVSVGVLAGVMALDRRGARSRVTAFAAIAGLIAGIALFNDTLRSGGGETADDSATLVSRILSGGDLSVAVEGAIADPNTALSVRERLMIWSNAVEVWARNPIFGSGVAWLDNWEGRKYPQMKFNLLHNGYLEILVRYGVTGLLFYAFVFAWSLRNVRKASKAGLVDASAYQAYLAAMIFFAVSLFTNSNNRLAFGETYMWFAAAFGFYCYYLLQERQLVKVGTYF